MRFVVVHAHPDPASYSRLLCDTATAALARGGHDTTVIDLYADGFDPRLSKQEREAYHGTDPILSDLVRRYADLLLSHDGLVFVYPSWWWGLPAILKGFLDRVFAPGVAFHLDERTQRVRPGLRHLRRIVVITTHGAARTRVLRFTDTGHRTITRCVRILAPRRCRTTSLRLYGMDASTESDRHGFLDRVDRTLGDLR